MSTSRAKIKAVGSPSGKSQTRKGEKSPESKEARPTEAAEVLTPDKTRAHKDRKESASQGKAQERIHAGGRNLFPAKKKKSRRVKQGAATKRKDQDPPAPSPTIVNGKSSAKSKRRKKVANTGAASSSASSSASTPKPQPLRVAQGSDSESDEDDDDDAGPPPLIEGDSDEDSDDDLFLGVSSNQLVDDEAAGPAGSAEFVAEENDADRDMIDDDDAQPGVDKYLASVPLPSGRFKLGAARQEEVKEEQMEQEEEEENVSWAVLLR